MLYGMADALGRALTATGERVRVYMPFGELIPGMAYLVRRLLENTSNESFLRQRTAGDQPPETLLDPPSPGPATHALPQATRPRPAERFVNEPHADFAVARVRHEFAAALHAVRREFGQSYPLVIGGRRVDTAERLISRNPSRKAEVIGRTGWASAEDVVTRRCVTAPRS